MRHHIVSHRVLPYRMPAKRQGTLDAWLVMVAHQTDAMDTFYAYMALVEGIRHSALCAVLIVGTVECRSILSWESLSSREGAE
jgi:hypothetical protein